MAGQQKQLFLLPWATQEPKEHDLIFVCLFCFYLDHTCKAPPSFPKGGAHTEHLREASTTRSHAQHAFCSLLPFAEYKILIFKAKLLRPNEYSQKATE